MDAPRPTRPLYPTRSIALVGEYLLNTLPEPDGARVVTDAKLCAETGIAPPTLRLAWLHLSDSGAAIVGRRSYGGGPRRVYINREHVVWRAIDVLIEAMLYEARK